MTDTVVCIHCGQPAERITGYDLYRRRRDLHDAYFWRCTPCNAWAGCHPGTDKPLGPLAKADTRLARQRAHHIFDSIWKQAIRDGQPRNRARSAAYRWISQQLGGIPANIGQMDAAQCARVIEICKAARGQPLIAPLAGDAAGNHPA